MRAPLGTGDNPILTQAQNHRAIAAWYDRAAQEIHSHGQAVTNQINSWLPDTATTYSTQWLSPLVYDRLVNERNAHLRAAEMLESYADALNQAEAGITAAQS